MLNYLIILEKKNKKKLKMQFIQYSNYMCHNNTTLP